MYNIKLPNRNYKILFVPDVHLREEEFKGTIGYVAEQERIIHRLNEGARNKVFDMVIFLGDLQDTFYTDTGKLLYHISLLSTLSENLDGRVFKVLGNHTLNKGKSRSLSMFLAGNIKSARVDDFNKTMQFSSSEGIHSNYGMGQPILHVTDRIFVNDNVFNLFHFNRFNKNYYDNLSDLSFTPKHHIGVYHDSIISSRVRKYISTLLNDNVFQIPSAVTTDNTEIFNNIHHAVVGDIHTKIGEFIHVDPLTGKETIVDIPGSLGRTQNSRAQQHNHVDLPFMEVSIDGSIKKSHIRFDLLDHKQMFKAELLEEKKDRDSRLEIFNNAISVLEKFETIEKMLEVADIRDEVKFILTEALEGRTPPLDYRKSEDNMNLIRRNL